MDNQAYQVVNGRLTLLLIMSCKHTALTTGISACKVEGYISGACEVLDADLVPASHR